MSNLPEFAPEYTKTERLRIVALIIIGGIALISVQKLWLGPLLYAFVEASPCGATLGISHIAWLVFGLFVGLPVLVSLLVAITLGCRGYKILRDGQFPPLREKVFRPTRIERGTKAKVRGYLHVFTFAPFLAMAIWGGFQAQTLSESMLVNAKCVAKPAVEGEHGKRPSV